MAKRFTASSEGKDGGEFKRGALLCFDCFSERASLFFAFVLSQLCFTRMESSLSFFTGKNRPLEDSGGFPGFFVFCYFSPLEFGKWLLNRGCLLESWKTQRDVGQGEIRKPAALPRKKYQWPWTVLIFPNRVRCGEKKKKKREASSPLHLLKLRRLLGIWNQPRQQTF